MRLLGAARPVDESDTRSATVALVGAGCSRPVLTLFTYNECLEGTNLLRIHTIPYNEHKVYLSITIQSTAPPAVLDRAMEPDYGNTQMVLSIVFARAYYYQCVFPQLTFHSLASLLLKFTGVALLLSIEGSSFSITMSWIPPSYGLRVGIWEI